MELTLGGRHSTNVKLDNSMETFRPSQAYRVEWTIWVRANVDTSNSFIS